jgi:hypothetical protein
MVTLESLTHRFEKVFERRQASVLAEAITDAYSDLVKTSDFNELKAIVKELAEAQQDLVEAQRRTEQSLNKLTLTVSGLAEELGGVSKSMAYALENEAYRGLPGYLEKAHGIHVQERIVRTEIGGEEINLFARGERDGEPVLLVGESKTQLDERRRNRQEADRVFKQLETKIKAVKQAYPELKIIPLLITHYARPKFLEHARDQGILVIQSFEWA